MIEELPSLIANNGFPIAVVVYLLWERHSSYACLKNVIKTDLTGVIYELKEEIIRFSERCNGGKKI